jgi:hypothetical protein
MTTLFEAVYPVFVAAGTAAVYGAYAYLMKKLPDPSTEFEGEKFVGTILVGAGVGLVFYFVGMPVNEGAVLAAMTTIGAVEIGQKIVKPIFNWLREQF